MQPVLPEILSKIFLNLPLSFGPFPSRNPFRPDTVPILNVCRAWREAALSTPELWCNLEIKLSEFLRDLATFQRMKDNLPRFFQLSGSRPLSLTIHGDARVYIGVMFNCLSKELHRVGRLSARLRFINCSRLVENLNRMGNLTALDLHQTSSSPLYDPLDNPRTISILPHLRRLRLVALPSDSLPYLMLPVLQELYLSEASMTIHWVHHLIFSSSRTLRLLNFRSLLLESSTSTSIKDIEDEFNTITPELDLPRLEYFSITATPKPREMQKSLLQYSALLAECITYPCELRFHGPPLPFLQIFHSESVVRLRLYLEICYAYGGKGVTVDEEFIENKEEIAQLLRGFPALEELIVQLDTWDDGHERRKCPLFHQVFRELSRNTDSGYASDSSA